MSVEENFDGMEEQKPEYKNLRWGKVGDWFKGTLVDNTRQIRNNLSEKKEMQTIYEFLAHAGSFHDIIDKIPASEATVIKKGEFWSFITSKPAITMQLKKASIGQVVGLRFAEETPPKTPGHSKTKVIKIFLGAMDPEYQGQTSGD